VARHLPRRRAPLEARVKLQYEPRATSSESFHDSQKFKRDGTNGKPNERNGWPEDSSKPKYQSKKVKVKARLGPNDTGGVPPYPRPLVALPQSDSIIQLATLKPRDRARLVAYSNGIRALEGRIIAWNNDVCFVQFDVRSVPRFPGFSNFVCAPLFPEHLSFK
jgi:hypothetical protein